ncbi:phosphopentomutase [Paracoccus aerodenitrificans]|uniref:phosphopentomutase n=1 Tax=Paracoccus aerodenitrificans TaxID=3017781 RepID=UPI0022F0CBBA|nr:phosphopentomutase [Paracoccus aerodenitrificans]WBU64464.1 phosphopentomutase [Paracoccus aerodenitrificans]
MTRAFLVVMDSVGIGGAPDADRFFNEGRPDTGANTVLHIAEAQGLHLPNLDRLGLGAAIRLASGQDAPGLRATPEGLWGAATEISPGKDTPSGHWEISGVPVPWDWHYFPDTQPAFPPELTAHVCELAGTEAVLGNKHASGTVILQELGAEHMRTGWPICYTSADSVFQIAAHEETFGLDRLLALCEALAPALHKMRVGRVIARPFIGEPGAFSRTPNRRDYAMAPPSDTILDIAHKTGRKTHAIGKIGDIFSHRGISQLHKGKSDADLAGHMLRLIAEAEPGSLTFANFVEFDSLYGHRRDIAGYAAHLEWFDRIAGEAVSALRPGDLMIFTADHGNDPSWFGTDHTRERVPVLAAGVGAGTIGNVGFSDIGASVAAHLGIALPGHGSSFLGNENGNA